MARSKDTIQCLVRLPLELHRDMDALARVKKKSKAEIMRMALRQFVDANERDLSIGRQLKEAEAKILGEV